MGNSLCKERITVCSNPKNTVDRIIGRCGQLCSEDGTKSNEWPKHVLETGSPTRSQPQPSNEDGWQKVNLTVPNDKLAPENVRPIVPPRRKRSTTNQTATQRCGFKELFGSYESPRSSSNSLSKCAVSRTPEKEPETFHIRHLSKSKSDINLSERKTSCYSNTAETLRVPLARPLSLIVQEECKQRNGLSVKRKVSRVGNKKSDKFFGENISDCLSDEPLTPDSDNIPENILAAYSTEISKSIILNSTKAYDVISNKTNDDDSSLELDRKRNLDKKAEFLMAMLDNDDEQNDGTIIIKVPSRNVSQRNVKNHCEPIISNELATVEQNTIKKIAPNIEPNVAPRKFPRAKDVIENPKQNKLVSDDVKAETQVIKEKSVNTANPLINGEIFDNEPDKAMEMRPVKRVRHLSQENLMSKKILSTKSMDMIDLLQMEAMTKSQHANSQDKHILKKYNSQQSFLTNELMCQIADRVYGFRDPFEIDDHIYDDGSSKCVPNSKLATRKISAHRKEVVTRIDENVEENNQIIETVIHVTAIKGPEPMEESKSLILKCVDFIETERTFDLKTESIAPQAKINDSIQMNVSIASKNDKLTQSKVLADGGESSIMLLHSNEPKHSINRDDKTLKHSITKRLLKQAIDDNENGKRRDSIDELNQWFLKHKDLSDVPRRGSVDCVGYDTKRVFPFGKSDAGAGSNFFENKTLSKSLDNISNDQTDKANASGDHSILLKYLKKN